MQLDDLHAFAVSVMQGGRGLIARTDGARPAEPIEVFEFESCPFCRRLRETLSEFDLNYVSRTSAKGSAKRDILRARGGKAQFPYMIDPNTGTEMYESEDIIDYLHATYATPRAKVWRVVNKPKTMVWGSLTSMVRTKGGRVRRPRPEQPAERLVLYNFEASPYCRKVREALNELDLDVEVRNVAKRSPRRPELKERGGRMMVPYLIDPNTGTEMYESDDIVAYLYATYA